MKRYGWILLLSLLGPVAAMASESPTPDSYPQDSVHFNAASMRAFGRRYAGVCQELGEGEAAGIRD